jgi:hypothetical protein
MLRMGKGTIKNRLSEWLKAAGEWFWRGLTTPTPEMEVRETSWKAESWELALYKLLT